MRATFLRSEEDDSALEASNLPFWTALIDQIRSDRFERPSISVLDIGAHRGALLEMVSREWHASALYGIEPIANARKRALLRLRRQSSKVQLLAPAEWAEVPTSGIDLVLAVESLYMIGSLATLFEQVKRVLSPGGRAYFVLGCHAENPVWTTWRTQLEEMGHVVFTHRPMAILAAGAERGLVPSVRPLRRDGWITHDPRDPIFTFDSVKEMVDHHFAYKLLFRFVAR